MDIDKVAEAIWRADDDGSVIRRTLAKFHDWSNVSAAQQDRYRRMAQAAIDAMQLTLETPDIPVFVEDVPRRPIENMIGMEGQFHKHIEFIPHSRYKSPYFSADCPDCQEEFGIHDRRHAEILADTNEAALPGLSDPQ